MRQVSEHETGVSWEEDEKMEVAEKMQPNPSTTSDWLISNYFDCQFRFKPLRPLRIVHTRGVIIYCVVLSEIADRSGTPVPCPSGS